MPKGAVFGLAPLVVLPTLMIGLAKVSGLQWAPVFLSVGLWSAWRLCEASSLRPPAEPAALRLRPAD